ncbi:sugar phosphate isomerase/epimerase family protein [Flavobacterium sp. XS2P12]|uniref:sugar phosphate isomerase/epimerase family protein n=1 Tax=Flavobacterium melibiosi TaxID=3398734 RepID=UPI003A8387A0
MLNRRDFLKQTGTAALGGILISNTALANCFNAPAIHPIGVQLFTFINSIDNDVTGTLQKIANVGYKEIESSFSRKGDFYGMKPKEFAALIKDMGLSWISHQVIGAPYKLAPGTKPPLDENGKPFSLPPMNNLRDNGQQLIDEAGEAGVKYLVCANTPLTTLDEIKASIEVLNKTGETCKAVGITFAYHNHDAEFRPVEGQIPYDLILKGTNANTVKMELDLAWAVKGGIDPVELFKQNPGRFPLWHVKDIDKNHEAVLAVGSGTIDFKRIFDAAKIAGNKHFFVEHDLPKDSLESITSSYNYLNKILKV